MPVRVVPADEPGSDLAGDEQVVISADRRGRPTLRNGSGRPFRDQLRVPLRPVLPQRAVTAMASAADLREADPVDLITRLENRLHRLEERKATAVADADRARREITHARETLGQPFPHAAQLAEAREHTRQIDEKLQQMAEPQGSEPANPEAGVTPPRIQKEPSPNGPRIPQPRDRSITEVQRDPGRSSEDAPSPQDHHRHDPGHRSQGIPSGSPTSDRDLEAGE